jgi:hypothetical protein
MWKKEELKLGKLVCEIYIIKVISYMINKKTCRGIVNCSKKCRRPCFREKKILVKFFFKV